MSTTGTVSRLAAIATAAVLALLNVAAPSSAPAPLPVPAQSGAPLLGWRASGGAPLPVVAFDDRTAEQRVWRLGQLVVKATSTPATGRASWYAARGNVAAVHSWRRGDEPYRVRVCASRCVNVTVADWCQCFIGSSRERLIDLSDDAFRKLAPLSVGLLRVTVVRLPTR